MRKSLNITFILLALLAADSGFAQPKVGRKAAAKYFESEAPREPAQSAGPNDNMLMLHLGRFVGSQAYNWQEPGKVEGVGKSSYGLTYLFSEWAGFDTNLRVDFNEYELTEAKAVKLSLMPLWTFPKAESRFPLYFGFGLGVGVYFQQLPNKSNLAADYQLLLGARFMDLTPGLGFFVEYGMKNHLHLLSEGQFNGSVLSLGAVFNF